MTTQDTLCDKCGRSCEDNDSKSSINTNNVTCDSDSIIKCQRWLLEKCSISDGDSEYSRGSLSTASTSHGYTDCSEENEYSVCPVDNAIPGELSVSQMECARNTYGDIEISNSERVHIGNITYITGPVNITQTTSTIRHEKTVNQVFLDGSAGHGKSSEALRIIQRRDWLAQPPMNKTPLPESVKYVVIAHTATEEGFTQAENTLLVRLVQTFHIESRKWDDIAYNFLIGSDGNVYEGRSWGLQGAFAHGYNKNSVGIAFVGCFMDHLPPTNSLKAAQKLLEHGVELGFLPRDYVLVGHCQCSAVESPGRQLYEEIKTWPNWRAI